MYSLSFSTTSYIILLTFEFELEQNFPGVDANLVLFILCICCLAVYNCPESLKSQSSAMIMSICRLCSFLAMPSCEALSSRSHALEPMLHVQFVRSNAMQPCTALHSLLLSI